MALIGFGVTPQIAQARAVMLLWFTRGTLRVIVVGEPSSVLLLWFHVTGSLCGIVVVSFIDRILKPRDCKDLKAVSLPDPGPFT